MTCLAVAAAVTCLTVCFLGAATAGQAPSDPYYFYPQQPVDPLAADPELQLILGARDGQYNVRDVEQMPQNSLWGHKYVAGGAGEGQQFLKPSGNVPNREEVKTDAVLPAYCDPPNPCPPGLNSDDGCLEDFENTAEFSRQYQNRQQCMCDEEHMFSCPQSQRKLTDDQEGSAGSQASFADVLERLMEKQNIADQHKGIRAKKFHEKKRNVKKRSVQAYAKQNHPHNKYNPYLAGDKRVHIVSKKGGKF